MTVPLQRPRAAHLRGGRPRTRELGDELRERPFAPARAARSSLQRLAIAVVGGQEAPGTRTRRRRSRRRSTPSPAAAGVSAASDARRALDLEPGALDELARRGSSPSIGNASRPRLAVAGEQAQEEQELLLDRHLAGLARPRGRSARRPGRARRRGRRPPPSTSRFACRERLVERRRLGCRRPLAHVARARRPPRRRAGRARAAGRARPTSSA